MHNSTQNAENLHRNCKTKLIYLGKNAVELAIRYNGIAPGIYLAHIEFSVKLSVSSGINKSYVYKFCKLELQNLIKLDDMWYKYDVSSSNKLPL